MMKLNRYLLIFIQVSNIKTLLRIALINSHFKIQLCNKELQKANLTVWYKTMTAHVQIVLVLLFINSSKSVHMVSCHNCS